MGFTSSGSIDSETPLTSRKLEPGGGPHAADRTSAQHRVDDVVKLCDSEPETMAAKAADTFAELRGPR
jgi:hypothetical protein